MRMPCRLDEGLGGGWSFSASGEWKLNSVGLPNFCQRAKDRCIHVEFSPVVDAEAFANAHHLMRCVLLFEKDQSASAMLAIRPGGVFAFVVTNGRLVAAELTLSHTGETRGRDMQPLGIVPKRTQITRSAKIVFHGY